MAPEFAIKNGKPVNMFDMSLAEGKTGTYSNVPLSRSISYEEEIHLLAFNMPNICSIFTCAFLCAWL